MTTVTIKDPTPCVALEDVPEDEHLVVYEGKLCIIDYSKKGRQLYTEYGEMLDTDDDSPVHRIKSITVEY
jgi:hypothetical protein